MNQIEDVFVINLKECTRRLASLTKNMGEQGIKFKRWDAVKGKDLPYSEIKQRTSYMCRHFMCNAGTIGCHLSHLNLWDFIATNYGPDPDKWFIILEDDASILDGFKENIANIFSEMKRWPLGYKYPEFIHLSCNFMCKIKNVTRSIFESSVISTTRGYMISAKGAAKLVQNIKRVMYHVDMYLTYQQIVYGNLGYYTSDVYIGNNDALVSTISSNTFPRLLPDMLNAIIPEDKNHLHILYESQLFTFMNTTSVNITIIVSIVFLALLFAREWYIVACIYCLSEIIYYHISLLASKKNKKEC